MFQFAFSNVLEDSKRHVTHPFKSVSPRSSAGPARLISLPPPISRSKMAATVITLQREHALVGAVAIGAGLLSFYLGEIVGMARRKYNVPVGGD